MKVRNSGLEKEKIKNKFRKRERVKLRGLEKERRFREREIKKVGMKKITKGNVLSKWLSLKERTSCVDVLTNFLLQYLRPPYIFMTYIYMDCGKTS